MGIKLLNTFILKNAKNAGVKTHLSELRGKKIAIDVSIYLYRFSVNNNLIRKLYEMCRILRYYKIHPIFVFDGKKRNSLKEKTLKDRSNDKKIKSNDYNIMLNKLKESPWLINNIIFNKKLKILERSIVTISSYDIKNTKDLLDAFGMSYIQSNGEADELCAALANSGMVYGCLSEDTDMFAYGIKNVIKYFSFVNNTVIIYNTDKILEKLNLTMENFRDMCIISGTDYNNSQINIFKLYDIIKRYDASINFKKYLIENNYISMEEYEKCIEINTIYNLNSSHVLKNYKYMTIRNKYINNRKLREVLQR
jgi:5'-3' exonuclease